MASIYLSICSTSKPLAAPPKSAGRTTASASSSSSCFKSQFCGCFVAGRLVCSGSRKQKKQMQVVSMAPDEEKLTRRSPLDFPIGLQLYFEVDSLKTMQYWIDREKKDILRSKSPMLPFDIMHEGIIV
ncbi:hypothetical protein POTOM_057236 [Populus tomentosa]|uniref:Uncharacterized protein n=1 Tax=Populus tomentosa TaxID=118781 RepID=A0A8X7XWP7_POPTO|nr:hypothetical protein POTOM_057236 [Populus tomentosa]